MVSTGPYNLGCYNNVWFSAEVLANICSTYQCLDCPNLLAKNADLLSAILGHIKEILTKDSWKCYPVYKQALIWVIKCLKVSVAGLLVLLIRCGVSVSLPSPSLITATSSNIVDVG